jgi:hypothetical protein
MNRLLRVLAVFAISVPTLVAPAEHLVAQVSVEPIAGVRRYIRSPSGQNSGVEFSFRPIELLEYGVVVTRPIGPTQSGLALTIFDASYGAVGENAISGFRGQYSGFALAATSSVRLFGGRAGETEVRFLGTAGAEWLTLAGEERARREMTVRVGPQIVAPLGSSIGATFTPELGVAMGRFIEEAELPPGFSNPKPVWLGFRVGLLWTP